MYPNLHEVDIVPGSQAKYDAFGFDPSWLAPVFLPRNKHQVVASYLWWKKSCTRIYHYLQGFKHPRWFRISWTHLPVWFPEVPGPQPRRDPALVGALMQANPPGGFEGVNLYVKNKWSIDSRYHDIFSYIQWKYTYNLIFRYAMIQDAFKASSTKKQHHHTSSWGFPGESKRWRCYASSWSSFHFLPRNTPWKIHIEPLTSPVLWKGITSSQTFLNWEEPFNFRGV